MGTSNSSRAARKDQQHLHVAEEHVGQDLADHHLQRPHRRGQQVFQRAALAFARHGHGRHHHQRHRQDHAHQPRHHVVGGDAFGVVAAVQAQLEGRMAGAQRGQRAHQLMHQRQRGSDCSAATAGPVAAGSVASAYTASAGLFAAQQAAREVGREDQRKLHLAGLIRASASAS
jgi:hypothetical protein